MGYTYLTHLPLDKNATISKTLYSYAFSWMKYFVFWFEFRFGALAPNKLQAIILTNADPIHWYIYALLWGDELTRSNR